ncbi:MAG: pyruvate kinase [Gammaproteobacteria bacterium]|jgi:pyruvate kinase|nr:pyruvate kinase [Gammaproteobacteria bacterium]
MTSSLAILPSPNDPLHDLLNELLELKQRILSGTVKQLAELSVDNTHSECLLSLENLLHYIVMRREDLRPLQARLAKAGLSSLGRGEPHVLDNIERVINLLARAVLQQSSGDRNNHPPVDYETGHRLLRKRAEKLFGKARAQRDGYIMVTMPSEAAANFELVNQLVAAGMDTARINCAHDDSATWHNMIINIRLAAKLQERNCRILMDLGGHKIRTRHIITSKDKAGSKSSKKHARVHHNDWLVLSKKRGSPEVYDALFDVPVKAVITCSYPDIIRQLHKNETVWIDDGKIGTVIREKRGDAVLLQVNRAGPRGARIKQEKGLNFPETRLNLPALSERDRKDLQFVSQHADMVGLSFAECAEDVLHLQEQLRVHGADDIAVIAKIETARAVKNLPDIISGALAHNIQLGIMVARGDLAIELGSVRMAEIQEEILWVCEAAHLPVIWATQVFESLAKNGLASRPEITDAAMAARAECVMLNKGPYIDYAVSILSDILQRMGDHQYKKISRLRALHW